MADDYTDDTQTTGAVTVGGSATGDVETDGDRDWFAVTLEAGNIYRFDLEGIWTNLGTLRNPYLRGIYDAGGALIGDTTDDDGGFYWNSRVTFTAPDTATYYVSAGAVGDRKGTYRLSVTDVTDDYTDDTQTTGAVTVDGSVRGSIETGGDRDWFAVTLVAGNIYRFDLGGSENRAVALRDPYLRGIYDAGGALIGNTTDDNGGSGLNSRVTFTAPDTATYYVSAGADGEGEGAYWLSVTDVTDDYTDDTQTTGSVTVGGSVTGEIDFGGDRDWFAVRLVAGNIYQFDLEGSVTHRGTLNDPNLHGIYDAGGTLIGGTTNDDGGLRTNSRVTFRATHTATYYVSASDNGLYDEGTYRLSVTDVTASVSDDFRAWTDTTGTVTVGGSATGEIEFFHGDRDWFEVTLEAGKSYFFDLEGRSSSRGTLRDPYLHGIYDAEGNRISGTTDDKSGFIWNSQVKFTATTGGTYYVSAGTDERADVPEEYYEKGTYRLSVTEIGVDLTAGSDTTGVVTVGGSIKGLIESHGDRDWFAVTLVAGKTYRFDLEGGTLGDTYLYGIHDANGVLLDDTTNDDGGSGNNSRVTFKATAGGTYYVSTGAYRGDQAGTYTLSVKEIGDDFTAGSDTTGAVTVGGSVRGNIETNGDRDWFAVTLDADKTYRFDLEGVWTQRGTLRDPYLRGIYDAEGRLIAGTTDNNGGSGENSRVTFAATTGGTHYVSAGGNGGGKGTYTLWVRDVTDQLANDLTAGIDTTGTVTVGGSATGSIDFLDDRDWFAVTLDADKTYRFDLESSGAVALPDPYLRGIYNAEGTLIDGTTNDDFGSGRNSRVTFTATTGGTYYVSAGDYGDGEGAYTLSVTDVTDSPPILLPPTDDVSDDFTAWTDTTGRVTVGGSATGEIESAGDHDWFAVTLAAGKTYRFNLEGTGAVALSDPYLRGIYDADSNYINDTRNDDDGSGLNSRVTFAVTTGGTYYVSAGAYGGGEGAYRLSVMDVTDSFSSDLTAGTGTTGRVTVGGSATGSIDFDNDHDWFAVTLEAGKAYRFNLEGTGAGALYDPYLRGIYDAEGNYINDTRNDDVGSGLNSRVTFAATTDGTYYVSAGAYGGGEGAYRLSVMDVTDSFSSDLTAGIDTTGTVTVDGSATGSIDFEDDRDWFAVTLDAGTTYRFDLEGSGNRNVALYDPYLRGIYDANGNYISDTRNDDFGSGYNSQVTFTATADAVHYVSAGAYRASVGGYTLSVEEVM